MKIAICDDNSKDIELLHNHILTHTHNHEIIEFLSPKPFLQRFYAGEHFDILFIDVQMPNSDGWEIARELKETKTNLFIVVVTVLGERIYNCFDRVNWFVEKPVSEAQTHEILDKAHKLLFPRVIEFRSEKMTLSLTAPEIISFEIQRNDLLMQSVKGQFKFRSSMKDIHENISDMPCFVQTHQSYIINLDFYHEIDGNDIMMKNGIRIPLSRKQKKPFFDSMAAYIRR